MESPENIKDLEPLLFFQPGVGAIAQTTQSEENFEAAVKALQLKFNDLAAHKTICGATTKRQSAAVELARKVDLMLIIGDRMSANTKRLTELCAKTGTETHQIQTVEELNPNWLMEKEKIGITAGASTPEWIIAEVIKALPPAPSAPARNSRG
ncbi:hypothetical protein HZB08_02875 [Candidatus Saganbacteria bacterium]|uniref:4-hydroxy-3-methylbut-2-enyl diphosphate reductase n=1 Tax=Candidatus Saganbacteria bacterium TaxID=2575572 RepID=A0A9D6UNM4_UNCSA|nr:hypothetical protein [Candidatus Saganbacteria bacterium]